MNRFKYSLMEAGMSLTEMVLVICIIGIFAAVAVIPFSRASHETLLGNAADRVVSDLNLIRDQARRERKPYTVIFNTGNLSYSAANVTDLLGATGINVDLSHEYHLDSVTLNLDSSAQSITFNPRGYPSHPGVIVLYKGSKEIMVEIFKNGKIKRYNPI